MKLNNKNFIKSKIFSYKFFLKSHLFLDVCHMLFCFINNHKAVLTDIKIKWGHFRVTCWGPYPEILIWDVGGGAHVCTFLKSSTNDSNVQFEPLNRSHYVNTHTCGCVEVEATPGHLYYLSQVNISSGLVIVLYPNAFHLALRAFMT